MSVFNKLKLCIGVHVLYVVLSYVVLFTWCSVICFGFLLGGRRLRCLKKLKYLGQNAK